MDTARGVDEHRIDDRRDDQTGMTSGDAGAGSVAEGSASPRGCETTDAGVNDAMFDLGGDERRMHVRAYNYWVSLLKGRPYPSIENLDPATITDFGPHSVLLDFSEGVANPRIAYLGRALREECGLEGSIATIADVPSRSLLSRLTDHYLQIIANRAPIGFEAEFVGSRGRTTLYRGILMPFSSRGDEIDYLYGVINWKELVDAAVQATLDAELDAAVRAAPHAAAPGATVAPVWADGPSGGFNAAIEGTVVEPPKVEPEAAYSGSDAALDALARAAVAVEIAGGQAFPAIDAPLPAGPLGEQLVMARESAAQVRAADARSRAALYRTLARAHDFSLSADSDPAGYAAILSSACIAVQDRAPMTSIVTLIFGVDYDTTRLADFAAVLLHARRHHVPAGGLASFLDGFEGGIKAIVPAERLHREPQSEHAEPLSLADRAALAQLSLDSGGAPGSTVLLVTRVRDDGGLDIVGTIAGDEALNDRAMNAIG